MGFLVNGLAAAIGAVWAVQTSAADQDWTSLAYGNGMFVAVSTSGTGTRVMSSPDGKNWTIRSSAADSAWRDVTFGAGIFVAVAFNSSNIMTSPDGITWTLRTGAVDNGWRGIAYGNGVFVAVAQDGGGNNVQTSKDGITWTIRAASSNSLWYDVCFGNGLFVAVGISTPTVIMTSPDGITWTARSLPASIHVLQPVSVTYGNGLFVAVNSIATENASIFTSPNGITWTLRTHERGSWTAITYGNGLFVAVSSSYKTLTSTDGVTWNPYPSPNTNAWRGVTYGNGIFVAVSNSGTANRIMTSGAIENPPPQPNAYTIKITTNETANRALNTTYTNTGDSTLLVQATVAGAITLTGGVATAQAKSGSSTPPTTAASGIIGIPTGLVNEANNYQVCFTVAPGMNYRIDTEATNGTVTLGNWFEMRF